MDLEEGSFRHWKLVSIVLAGPCDLSASGSKSFIRVC